MGNASKPITPVQINQPVYTDPGARTLRQLQTFQFPQTITSTTTVAIANALPQITQGNELWNGVFTAASLQSLIEVDAIVTITGATAASYFYIALFADYSPDALAVLPAGVANNGINVICNFKHYFQPVTAGPVRYSLRFAPNVNAVVANWYAYGGSRNVSRITFKEWTGPSIRNT